MMHFQRGSLRVLAGDQVSPGDQIGNCGNSGNSTQPHLHIQAMDSPDPKIAKGMPLRFEEFQQRSPRRTSTLKRLACPEQGSVVSRV
ncbi:MAG: hypothetical protein CSA83_01605 [Actinomycetales bacterium]|nr:MAG: hypothetical protein CSA83_01605 [Actinomycetales bacterium]